MSAYPKLQLGSDISAGWQFFSSDIFCDSTKMFTPLLGWLLLLLLRTACQAKPVDDTAIQLKSIAVAFRPLPAHQLTERANLLRLNVQQLIRDFVDPLSELIEEANKGDVESQALRLQLFVEQNSTYFRQLLGWLKFLAANISDICKHKRMRIRCQQWWLTYRYAMRTNVNAGAWPVRMNHVQFFKEWEWKLDWLLAMVSTDKEQRTNEPPAGGYGKLLEWIRWAGTPPTDAEQEETYVDSDADGTDNEVLSVTDQQLTSSAEDGNLEAAGHPVKVLYNVFYPNDVEPLYHAEIQVHGVVYSFGNKYGISIYDQQKRKEQNVREKTEVFETYLGSTQFGPAQVQAIIDDLTVSGFAGYQYELVNHSCQHFAGAFVDRLLLGDRRTRDWPPVLHPYTTLSENTAIIEAFKKTLDTDEKEDDEEEDKKQAN